MTTTTIAHLQSLAPGRPLDRDAPLAHPGFDARRAGGVLDADRRAPRPRGPRSAPSSGWRRSPRGCRRCTPSRGRRRRRSRSCAARSAARVSSAGRARAGQQRVAGDADGFGLGHVVVDDDDRRRPRRRLGVDGRRSPAVGVEVGGGRTGRRRAPRRRRPPAPDRAPRPTRRRRRARPRRRARRRPPASAARARRRRRPASAPAARPPRGWTRSMRSRPVLVAGIGRERPQQLVEDLGRRGLVPGQIGPARLAGAHPATSAGDASKPTRRTSLRRW